MCPSGSHMSTWGLTDVSVKLHYPTQSVGLIESRYYNHLNKE